MSPAPLTLSEKEEFMRTLSGVSLASDAFFPFRDSLDVASTKGVSYVVAAGGSVADAEVIAAADEYNYRFADDINDEVLDCCQNIGEWRVDQGGVAFYAKSEDALGGFFERLLPRSPCDPRI